MLRLSSVAHRLVRKGPSLTSGGFNACHHVKTIFSINKSLIHSLSAGGRSGAAKALRPLQRRFGAQRDGKKKDSIEQWFRCLLSGSVPPFPIRVTIVSLSVGLGTPIYALLGCASIWVRILPKSQIGRAVKTLCTVGLGGGFLTFAYNYVIPFLRDHSDVVLPFALANTISAGFWYGLLDLVLGFDTMFALPASAAAVTGVGVGASLYTSLEKSIIKGFSVFPLFRNMAHIPIAGVTVGVLTALTAPLLWSRCIDICWTDEFKALVFGYDVTPSATTTTAGTSADVASTSWLIDLYNNTLLVPVGLPIGALVGMSVHFALRPLLTGVVNGSQRPWGRVALPAAGVLAALSGLYFSFSKPYMEDFLWIQRLDPITNQLYSYNIRSNNCITGSKSVGVGVGDLVTAEFSTKPLKIARDSENYRSFFCDIRGWNQFASGIWGWWSRVDNDEGDVNDLGQSVVTTVAQSIGLSTKPTAGEQCCFGTAGHFVNYDVNGLMSKKTTPTFLAATSVSPGTAVIHPRNGLTLQNVDEVILLYHYIDAIQRYKHVKSSYNPTSNEFKDMLSFCQSSHVGINDMESFISLLKNYYQVSVQYEKLRQGKDRNALNEIGQKEVEILASLAGKLEESLISLQFSKKLQLCEKSDLNSKTGAGFVQFHGLLASTAVMMKDNRRNDLNKQYKWYIIDILLNNAAIVANHLFSEKELTPNENVVEFVSHQLEQEEENRIYQQMLTYGAITGSIIACAVTGLVLMNKR